MLSETTVRQAKPKDRDYKLSDAEGLYLFVTKTGHRSWRLKYRFAGKERRLILGGYPTVSLKEARERKTEARKLLDEGRDPGIEAKKQAVQMATARANTFEVLARTWFAVQEGRWTPIHARDVIQSLENEVFPWLGSPEQREVRIVMPEMISDLDPLDGYICLPGSLPPAPIHLTYKVRARIAAGYIPRKDFELVRGSKTLPQRAEIDETDEEDVGDGEPDDATDQSGNDESGRGAEAKSAGTRELGLKPPSKARRQPPAAQNRQGLLDLSEGLPPSDAKAQPSVPGREPKAPAKAARDDENPTPRDGDEARQTGEGQGRARQQSEERKRGEVASKRAQQRRAAIQRDAEGLSEPDKDRGPDLGDFGPG